MEIPSKIRATIFLKEFKNYSQKKFVFIEREKNLESIAQLGITISQAKDMIMNLTYENYSKGPKKDKDRINCNVWEFGSKINNEEVYIKLSDDFSNDFAKCISFHKADFAITYPLKIEKEKK